MGYETVTVVGMSRGHRVVAAHLDIAYLTNWRVRLVYSPALRRRIAAEWDNFHGVFRPPAPHDGGSQEHRAALELRAARFATHSDRRRAARVARRALFRRATRVSLCRIGCSPELWDSTVPPQRGVGHALARAGAVTRTDRAVAVELTGPRLVELLTELPLGHEDEDVSHHRRSALVEAVAAALGLVPDTPPRNGSCSMSSSTRPRLPSRWTWGPGGTPQPARYTTSRGRTLLVCPGKPRENGTGNRRRFPAAAFCPFSSAHRLNLPTRRVLGHCESTGGLPERTHRTGSA